MLPYATYHAAIVVSGVDIPVHFGRWVEYDSLHDGGGGEICSLLIRACRIHVDEEVVALTGHGVVHM